VVYQLWSSAAVLPELAKPVAELPVIKAAALKFLTTFRNQLPKPVVVQVLGQRTPYTWRYGVRRARCDAVGVHLPGNTQASCPMKAPRAVVHALSFCRHSAPAPRC
jgi:hypothetical protein